MANVEELTKLIGKTFTVVARENEGDMVTFSNTDDGYVLMHEQDCCESVYIHDVVGDLSHLENEVLIMAEVSSEDAPSDYGDAAWTFYRFATIKGYVTISFYGESNGYYSIGVSLIERTEHNNYLFDKR